MGLQLNIPGLQIIIDRVIISGLNQNIPKNAAYRHFRKRFPGKALPKVYIRQRFESAALCIL